MGIRAHIDQCPWCQCWTPEEGETMVMTINGSPVQPGETRTVTGEAVVSYVFTSGKRPHSSETIEVKRSYRSTRLRELAEKLTMLIEMVRPTAGGEASRLCHFAERAADELIITAQDLEEQP